MKRVALPLSAAALLVFRGCAPAPLPSQTLQSAPLSVSMAALSTDGLFHFLGADSSGNLLTGAGVTPLPTLQRPDFSVALTGLGPDGKTFYFLRTDGVGNLLTAGNGSGGGGGGSVAAATASSPGTVQLAPGQSSAVLAKVASTGNYPDLINKPTIPTTTGVLTNDAGFVTASQAAAAAPVASVNNKAGAVTLAAADVGALPVVATPNGNNGTVSGTITYVTGKPGFGLAASGFSSSNTITLGTFLSQLPPASIYSIRVLASYVGNGNTQFAASTGRSNTTWIGWDNNGNFVGSASGMNNGGAITSTHAPTTDALLHQLEITVTASTLYMCYDGANVTSTNLTGTPIVASQSTAGIGDLGDYNALPFAGKIQEVSYFQGVQVCGPGGSTLQTAPLTGKEPGLIAHYGLNGNANDSSYTTSVAPNAVQTNSIVTQAIASTGSVPTAAASATGTATAISIGAGSNNVDGTITFTPGTGLAQNSAIVTVTYNAAQPLVGTPLYVSLQGLNSAGSANASTLYPVVSGTTGWSLYGGLTAPANTSLTLGYTVHFTR